MKGVNPRHRRITLGDQKRQAFFSGFRDERERVCRVSRLRDFRKICVPSCLLPFGLKGRLVMVLCII